MSQSNPDTQAPSVGPVALIGLGTMGRPMARNLARAGLLSAVCSRSHDNARAVAAQLGVRSAATPAETARGAAFVVVCVPDTPQVEQVLVGDDGVIAGAAPGTITIDCSTIAPEAVPHLASRLLETGIVHLDAPVSGGEKGAIEGTLSFFVGGSPEALGRARPVLEVMGKKVTHLGSSGCGQLGKAVNQILVAGNLLAVSEALCFAEKNALPLDALHAALTGGAANSWALTVLGRKMIDRDFKPAFAVKHQQKDLAIVLRAAREKGVPLPGTSLVHQLLTSLEAEGRQEDGTQALITVLERLAGIGSE